MCHYAVLHLIEFNKTNFPHLLNEIQIDWLKNVQRKRGDLLELFASLLMKKATFRVRFAAWVHVDVCLNTQTRGFAWGTQLGNNSFLVCCNSTASTHLDIIFMKQTIAGHTHCISEQQPKEQTNEKIARKKFQIMCKTTMVCSCTGRSCWETCLNSIQESIHLVLKIFEMIHFAGKILLTYYIVTF